MIAAFTAPADTAHKQENNEEIHLCIDDDCDNKDKDNRILT